MTRSLTAQELFDQLGDKLGLKVLGSPITSTGPAIYATDLSSRPALAGFLNLIHPNKVQVLGAEELTFLQRQSQSERGETLERLFESKPLILLVGDSSDMPESIIEAAEGTDTTLMRSVLPAYELVNYLQYYISRSLAHRTTLHGVFMEVFTIGVHIMGGAGCGKSELALELLTRGHRLIADDAPEFTQISPEIIDGTCPEALQDCLEVRGLGILNVRQMFGDAAIKLNKFLRLIIHLEVPVEGTPAVERDRLRGDNDDQQVLELNIPRITLQVRAGRNLAVMVEAAVRDFMLKMKGYDASAAFIERHGRLLQKGKRTLAEIDGTETQLLVVVSGLSGGGKSTALRALEDLGFYCVDNLPAALLPEFARQVQSNPQLYSRVSLGIDARSRGPELAQIPNWLDELSELGLGTQLLFLTADTRAIIKRFSETRRRHPLTRDERALPAAIDQEKTLLEPLQQRADWVIDTSDINIHQLRRQVWKSIGSDEQTATIVLESFAFKRGVPQDVDLVFDARHLPNPYWVDELRDLSGLEEPVSKWLEQDESVHKLHQDILTFLCDWLPEMKKSQRSYITIGIGCTGGRHRSVYLSKRLAESLGEKFKPVMLHHRELQA